MSARGRLVGEKKVRNGVLHIVAPQRGYLLKPQKPQKSLQQQKKEQELPRKRD
jgi:hypothetical protein